MAIQMRMSRTNYVATATMLTTPPQQPGWPATHAKYPQQPYTPWKTDNLTLDKDLRLDLGSAVSLGLLVAVNLDYSQVVIGLADNPGFSPLSYFSGVLTVPWNPWARRFTLVHLFTPPQTARYLLYRIPDTATSYYGLSSASTGGLWTGPLTPLPRDIRWNERPRIIEPHIDTPLRGGGTHRVMTGRPLVEMHAQRLATVNSATPATGDELAAWLELDTLMGNGTPCAWYFNRGNPAEGFIFRKMNDSDWPVNQKVSEDELILHEVVGP